MTSRPNSTLGVLVFYAVLVTAALLLVLARGPRGPGLTRAEAEREAERLAVLARHTRVVAPAEEGPPHVTWSPTPGGYRGLALLPQWRRDAADAGPEVHLAVRLTFDLPTLLRNPARPPLPSATLHREPPASDLVEPDHPRRLTLSVAPDGEAYAEARVSVDNVADPAGPSGPAGRAAETAVGRAWLAVADPAANEVPPEPWDLRVLDVLRPTLRGRICEEPSVWSSCRPTALTLARSHDPRTYRVTLMHLSPAPGTVAFELAVTADGDRLVEGDLRTLPGPTLDLPADLFVLPPRGSHEVAAPRDPGLVVAGWRPGDPRWETRRWTLDFGALLAGADW